MLKNTESKYSITAQNIQWTWKLESIITSGGQSQVKYYSTFARYSKKNRSTFKAWGTCVVKNLITRKVMHTTINKHQLLKFCEIKFYTLNVANFKNVSLQNILYCICLPYSILRFLHTATTTQKNRLHTDFSTQNGLFPSVNSLIGYFILLTVVLFAHRPSGCY